MHTLANYQAFENRNSRKHGFFHVFWAWRSGHTLIKQYIYICSILKGVIHLTRLRVFIIERIPLGPNMLQSCLLVHYLVHNFHSKVEQHNFSALNHGLFTKIGRFFLQNYEDWYQSQYPFYHWYDLVNLFHKFHCMDRYGYDFFMHFKFSLIQQVHLIWELTL